jgi:hypothetical protein
MGAENKLRIRVYDRTTNTLTFYTWEESRCAASPVIGPTPVTPVSASAAGHLSTIANWLKPEVYRLSLQHGGVDDGQDRDAEREPGAIVSEEAEKTMRKGRWRWSRGVSATVPFRHTL